MKLQINKKLLLENLRVEPNIKVTEQEIKKLLPKKFYDIFDLSNNNKYSKSDKFVNEFYNYYFDKVQDVFDFIPLGVSNANYTVYQISSKSLGKLYHDEFSKKPHGIKSMFEAIYCLEDMESSINFKKFNIDNKSELENVISKALGFPISIYNNDWKNRHKPGRYYLMILPQTNDYEKAIVNMSSKKTQQYFKKYQ
jgi:hypothetical protein